jgi:hypothetical protein
MWKCTNEEKMVVCAFGAKLGHKLVIDSPKIYKAQTWEKSPFSPLQYSL